jgi:DUF218 domain-containing protein
MKCGTTFCHWEPIRNSVLIFLLAFVTVVAGVWAWTARSWLLQTAADLWVVSDEITKADAAVVLGGGYDVRPVVAANLYKKRLVGKIVVSQTERAPLNVDVRVLRELGVPDTAIEFFGSGSRNTAEEAAALRIWAVNNRVSVLVIPVEVFFARRAQWILAHQFSGTGIRIEVPSFDPPHAYSRVQWWRTGGWSIFPTEVAKYIFYWLFY